MKKILPIFLLLAFLISSCRKDDDTVSVSVPAAQFSNKIPLGWNKLYLEVERYCPGYKPPVSARNYAYINLIAYESIVHGSNSKYKSFSSFFTGMNLKEPDNGVEYNWEVCMNTAYERAFELYFPTAPSEQQFKMLKTGLEFRDELQLSMDPEVYRRSAIYGRYVAQTIFDWTANDTWGHKAYLHNTDPSYNPPAGTGLWQPTYPDYGLALLPHWGKVRTFAALASDVVPPPPTFSTDPSSQLYTEAQDTRNLVNDIKAGGHPEDAWIAAFWSDDCPILTFSPAGRWVSIADQVIEIEQPDMLETVVTYAKLGMALSDAGIKCWQEKYKYNFLRPIDYIRDNMHDLSWNTIMCPDGSGGFYTPPFPTYPSGHATFGAAAAVVLEDVFGKVYNFRDRSHEGRTEFNGTPRSFSSFREMAVESAYSRVPLGVHFISDAYAGTNLGFVIGDRVNKLPWH